MKCELRITSGARSGQRELFEKSYIGLGRHPLSDIRFDAEQDLDASSRHAAIVKTGESYVLRDLGSTNGTLVNGNRIDGDRTLSDGDVIRCGVHGPEVSFNLIHETHDEVIMPAMQKPAPRASSGAPQPPRVTRDHVAAPPPNTPPRGGGAPAAPAPSSRTGILRAELQEQRSRFRLVALSLLIVMAGALGIVIWVSNKAGTAANETRVVIDSMRAEIATLRNLQAQADSEAVQLRSRIAAETDSGRRANLQRRLNTVQERASHIADARAVDWPAVVRNNRRAVAMIYVKFPDSSVWTGTAFGVDNQGRMLTNRHLVVNPAGQRAVEIAVQYSGDAEVHPARVERVSSSDDLAVIRLESAGPFPAVQGLADAPPVEGDPIGLLGFPFGRDLPQSGHPVASLFNGSISRIIPDSLLQLDAWSGTGASGSPIFDRAGRVVGVEFGGVADTGGRVVLGLPIRRAMALLGR